MDLTAAFDRVNREKLWTIMGGLGVDQGLINILRALHRNTTAKVRYNQESSTTEPFRCSSGVRQGCILAPFLFTLYINRLEQALSNLKVDSPRIGARGIPVLLYADDAVLLAHTPRGLQCLIDGFVAFMDSLDLLANLSKSYIMEAGNKPCKKFVYRIGAHTLGKVQSFSYLGILFDGLLNVKMLIEERCSKLVGCTGSIMCFGRRLGHWSPEQMVKLYNAICCSKVLYGAEVWGYSDAQRLQTEENKYLRRLLKIPHSTSSQIAHEELGMVYIKDLAQV